MKRSRHHLVKCHVRNFSLFWTILFLVLTFDTHFCFQYRLLYVKIGQPQDQNFTNLISFGRLTVQGNEMKWEQIASIDGSIQDSFTITK